MHMAYIDDYVCWVNNMLDIWLFYVRMEGSLHSERFEHGGHERGILKDPVCVRLSFRPWELFAPVGMSILM